MSRQRERCYFDCEFDGRIHVFPTFASYKSEELLREKYQKWISVLDKETRDKGDEYIRVNLRLCNKHFEECFILPSGRLTMNAIPTLNIEHKNKCTQQTEECTTKLNNKDLTKKLNCNEFFTQFVTLLNNQTVGTQLCNKEHLTDLSKDPFANEDEAVVTQPSHVLDILSDTDCIVVVCEELVGEEGNAVTERETFSWQKTDDVLQIKAEENAGIDPDNLSMYCDDQRLTSSQHRTQPKGDSMVHEAFRCNVCDAAISGFRYTCVQCNDFDLCGACETNREHRQHYMLRVPTPRPAAEVQAVLATVRRYLMKTLDPIMEPELFRDDVVSIKSEVKSENGDIGDDDNNDEPTNKPDDVTFNNTRDSIFAEHRDAENADCRIMTDVEELHVSESPAAECMVSTDCTGDVQTDTHTITTTADQVMVPVPQQQRESDSLPVPKNRTWPTKRDKKISIKRADIISRIQDRPSAKKIRLLPISNKTTQAMCHIKPDTVDSATIVTLPTELVQHAPLKYEWRPAVGSSPVPRVKLRGSPTEAVVRAGPTPIAFQYAVSSDARRYRSRVPTPGTDRKLLIKRADIMQILKKH